jgi:hypothetical protein
MSMTMMVWRLRVLRENKDSAAELALVTVPVVLVKMLQAQREAFRRRREWR